MAGSIQFRPAYRSGLAQFVDGWFGIPTPRPEYQVGAAQRSYSVAAPARNYAAVAPQRDYKVRA